MDYFSILNLDREPFSNSPEPDLFFLSDQHQRCLQRMELAIRLCRGLNVIVGEVGTGKTTLCRELILRLSAPLDDDHKIQTHLILDPSFSDPVEFLLAVSKLFGLTETEDDRSEWQLKELIKNYLFQRGVDATGIVVLIIDEGQKLPLFCVEILREFLNYETNERKLLQIVIFAQEEFRQILQKRANFTDRINEFYHLGPLSFREMSKMIRFRLARSCRDGTPPSLFTFAGLWAIHRATGGYPRKIVTLCHQVILSLIIKNQTKVDWFVVMACVKRILPERKTVLPWRRLTGAAGGLAIIAALPYFFQQMAQPPLSFVDRPMTQSAETSRVLAPSPDIVPVALSSPGIALEEKRSYPEPAKIEEPPKTLGSWTVKKGENFFRIVHTVYGDMSRENYQKVIRANAHIENVDQVKETEIIILPVLDVIPQLKASKRYWVRITEAKELEEAYALLKSYPRHYPPVRVLSYWNPRIGLSFALVLQNGFEDGAFNKESAIETAMRLPPALASTARIISEEQGTLFFKTFIE
jgi:general secretion pathway protein A